jgi:flavin-dependent dehydrogenase
MLLESARTVAVQIVRGARVTGVVKNRTRWDVTTTVGKDSIVFQSKLLIDATGRSRAVTGSEKRYVYDNLVAILAYVDAPTSDLRFELEATESGWWYSSALPGAKRVVAFVTDADLLPSGKYPCIQFFKTQLRKSSFSKLITHEPTIRFAATSSTFRQTVAGRAWASLGDAVATYDPLTGFGVPVAVSKGLGLGRILSQVDCDVAFRRYWQAEVEGFTEYLRVRRNLYRRENHWPRSVFWQRRRSQQSLFGQ